MNPDNLLSLLKNNQEHFRAKLVRPTNNCSHIIIFFYFCAKIQPVVQQFYSLEIDFLEHQTEDSTVIGFNTKEVPEGVFDFKAGQNITIKYYFDGEEIRRSYSICTCPSESRIHIGVRAIKDGLFSNFALKNLKVGDRLDILPPVGSFTIQGKMATSGRYVFFATGSGITPVISMIKDKLEKDPAATCTLFYSNRSVGSMMFRDELDGIKNKYSTRFQAVYLFSREQLDSDLLYGRMDGDKVRQLMNIFVTDKAGSQYFICGPEEQTIAIRNLLTKELGIPSGQVHFELFHTGDLKPEVKSQEEVTDFKGTAEVTVRIDGKETTFHLAYDKESILDAGIRQGLDLPYSCKGGVCCTCRAQLLEGKVHMDQNYALEDDEVEEGFILTCQSHPRAGKLFVDYDV